MMLDWRRNPQTGASTADGALSGQWYELRRVEGGGLTQWMAVFHDDHQDVTQRLGEGKWPAMKKACNRHANLWLIVGRPR
jgi:hypothetical protein